MTNSAANPARPTDGGQAHDAAMKVAQEWISNSALIPVGYKLDRRRNIESLAALILRERREAAIEQHEALKERLKKWNNERLYVSTIRQLIATEINALRSQATGGEV